MRPITIVSLIAALLFVIPVNATSPDPGTSTQALKKEISAILHKQDLEFLEQPVEKVSVEFLINAKNEIVVLHVEGTNDTTCERIKKILAFQEVRYRQPRQLVRYTVDLRLVK